VVINRTERGFDRVVNFSDAVVAIAITLLVLPLIDLLNDEQTETLGEVISKNGSAFVAYLIAFSVLAGYWRMHHQIYELIGNYDGWLMRLNLAWLLLVVLLPFLSASFSSYQSRDPNSPDYGDTLPLVLYLLTLALMSALMALMLLVVRLRPELRAPGTETRYLDSWRLIAFMVYELIVAAVAQISGKTWVAWGLLGLVVLSALFALRARRLGIPAI